MARKRGPRYVKNWTWPRSRKAVQAAIKHIKAKQRTKAWQAPTTSCDAYDEWRDNEEWTNTTLQQQTYNEQQL